MTGDIDSVAVSQGTTAGATDLAGFGSHLTTVNSPPAPELRENGIPFAIKAQSDQINPFDGQCSSDNVRGDATPTQKQQAATRPRKDSGWLSPKSDGGYSQSGCSSLSNDAIDTCSEDDAVLTPLTRRCSTASQPNTLLEDLRKKPKTHYDSSDAESAPKFTDDSDDSDMDFSRPYTASLGLPKVVHTRSQDNSVVSDGGAQDFLDSSKSSTTPPELPPVVTRSSAGANSDRYVLQRQIYNAMVTARTDDTSLPGQQFFPKNQLSLVINTHAVATELTQNLSQNHSADEIRQYAKAICCTNRVFVRGRYRDRSYRSIFAILVLVERSHLILSFIDEQVSDIDLPLVPIKESESIIGMRRRDTRPNGSASHPLQCFSNVDWSPASLSHFDRQQWHMISPFFSLGGTGQIKHYPLHGQHILPFIVSQGDSTSESHGGYGKVLMIHMHPAHHGLAQKNNADRGFAIKQLLTNDRKSFRKERKMLKKFGGIHCHPHIVSLLATYSHRGKYHFIFDRAQSDLGKFWEGHHNRLDMDHHDVLWISEQCLGLADGLFVIHRHKTFKTRSIDHQLKDQKADVAAKRCVKFDKSIEQISSRMRPSVKVHGAIQAIIDPARTYSSENESLGRYKITYGRHGDINPQNILMFNDEPKEPTAAAGKMRGTLKIADFGTAEMNSTCSRSGKRDVANTMTYRPPECDAADKTIRQSFDIWCLGCVFLEFATWMLGGDALVQNFALKRMSRDPTFNNDKTDTYFELIWKKEYKRTEARVKPSVVTFVETLHGMPHCTNFLHDLLTLIMHDMLVVDSEGRLTCMELRIKLRKIHQYCRSRRYAMHASQWRNGKHVKPQNFLQSSEIKHSKEVQRQIARNLPFKVVI